MSPSEYERIRRPKPNAVLAQLSWHCLSEEVRKLANREQVDSIAENVSIVWYRKVTYL